MRLALLSASTNCATPEQKMPAARTIEDTCKHYGWTRTFVYERLGARELIGLKAGRRTTITTESSERLFQSLPMARIRPPEASDRTV
jgi:hypothetical protein